MKTIHNVCEVTGWYSDLSNVASVYGKAIRHQDGSITVSSPNLWDNLVISTGIPFMIIP